MDNRLSRNHLGFLEVIEKPTSVELQAHYANHYFQKQSSSTYKASYAPDELSRIRERAELRRIAATRLTGVDTSSMLDVGCGEGWVLGAFFDAGWVARGIDFSEYGVASQNPRLRDLVTVGDVYEILDGIIQEGQRFGVVNLDHVLEHVLDPIALLRRLHSIVMPGGLLIVSVPNDGNALHEELFTAGKIERRWWIAPPRAPELLHSRLAAPHHQRDRLEPRRPLGRLPDRLVPRQRTLKLCQQRRPRTGGSCFATHS